RRLDDSADGLKNGAASAEIDCGMHPPDRVRGRRPDQADEFRKQGVPVKRTLLTLVALSCLVGGLAPSALAQLNSASTSASALATIVPAIAISKVADLDFGSVVAGGTSGTVALTASASPTRTGTGGTTLGNSTTVAAAQF